MSDENLRPIAASGQLSLVEEGEEVAPNIDVSVVNGHTSAMQLVRIHGDLTSLVFVADLLPTVHHAAAAWNMAYDLRPLTTMAEKSNLLTEASEKGWHLYFEHDPDVEVASVRESDSGFDLVDFRPLKEL